MIRMIIWIVWLICLLLLCVMLSRRILLTPQFGFTVSFLPQAIFILFFIDKWNVKLSDATMLVLLGGVTLFFVVSVVYMWFYMKAHNVTERDISNHADLAAEPIYVNKSVLIILLFLNLIQIILLLYYIIRLVPGGTLIEKFANLAWISKFGNLEDKVRFPFILNQLKAFLDAGGYLLLYLLIHSFVLKYKGCRMLLIMNLVCWLINMFISSNRSPFIRAFLVAVVLAYFIYGKSRGWAFRIRIGTLIKFLLLGILLICAMYWTLSWFGRDTRNSMIDYIGLYLSAPLKNLDTFIREGKFGSSLVHSETFRDIINSIGRLLGNKTWQYNLELPFRSVNGYSLGNVYTVFYCYLHDFSYPGLIGLVTLMAVISQAIYLKMLYGKRQHKISINTLLYAYIYQAILMSFFHDRFYSALFTMNMIKYLMSWWLLRIIFTKFKGRKIRIKVNAYK